MRGHRCWTLGTAAAWGLLVASGGSALAGATLVGHWKFDEGAGTTANDSSTKGNHGTVNGATWTTGKVGGCLQFAGTDSSYVEIPNETDYDLKDAVSYAVWVKADPAIAHDTWMGVITKGDHMNLQSEADTNHFLWQTKDYPGTISQYHLPETVNCIDNTWHHIAVTFDGTAQLKCIYVDGQLNNSAEAIGYINTTDYAVEIGKNGSAGGHAFKGLIDDVRIYDGALTLAEVKAIFQAKGVKIEATDPNAEEKATPDTGEFKITRVGMDETAELVVKIDYTTDSTATLTADYTTTPDISIDTVTIPANSPDVTITVTPVDDSDEEGTEEVVIEILADAGYSLLSPSKATVYIGDDDSPPGAFNLLEPADEELNVAPEPTLKWEAALMAQNYTLVLADNASFATPTLIDDDTLTATSYKVADGVLDYGNEYWWKVTARNANGPTEAANNPFSFTVGYGTPVVTIAASDPDAAEYPVDTGAFLVTKAFGDPSLALTVSFTFDTSTAELGVDYTANPDMASGTVTFAAATTEVTITVTPIDDKEKDGGETVVIVLADGGDDYDLGTDPAEITATVTISDDEIPPADFALLEPTKGAENVPLTPELKWETSERATRYRFVVSENEDLSAPVITGTPPIADPQNPSYTIPQYKLDYEHTYYWQVTAINIYGETAATGGPWSFTTGEDKDPPTVRRADADDDGAKVTIKFSEPMDKATTEDAFSMPGVTGTPTLSTDGMTLTFRPDRDLGYGNTYTVTIAATATDVAGNPLDGNKDGTGGDAYTFSFTTLEELVGVASGEGCLAGPGSAGAAWIALALAAVALRRRLS